MWSAPIAPRDFTVLWCIQSKEVSTTPQEAQGLATSSLKKKKEPMPKKEDVKRRREHKNRSPARCVVRQLWTATYTRSGKGDFRACLFFKSTEITKKKKNDVNDKLTQIKTRHSTFYRIQRWWKKKKARRAKKTKISCLRRITYNSIKR